MMLRTLILYNTLLITIVFGSNTTIPVDHSLALSLLTKETPKVESDAARPNLTIVTEGGSVAPRQPTLSSTPKDTHAILMTLDKELNKDKTVGSSESKVKPRKGVVYHVDNETISDDHIHTDSKNNSIIDFNDIKVLPHNMTEKPTPGKVKAMTTPRVLTHTLPAQKQKGDTILPKKPKILSNEALDKIVFSNRGTKLSSIGSSAKTGVADQIPSPNKRTEAAILAHPGMVMPIVITILVVPMFAVLGYMALKRGREAWKNRHYKRMDFLLDGMYNE